MTLDGRIVEYLENGKFICAFVFEDTGNRLHLLNQNSRELNLPLNRIVHFTKEKTSVKRSKEDIIGTLQETSKQREGLAQKINLAEIWELVSEKITLGSISWQVYFLAMMQRMTKVPPSCDL
jgi:exoribonuclease-2